MTMFIPDAKTAVAVYDKHAGKHTRPETIGRLVGIAADYYLVAAMSQELGLEVIQAYRIDQHHLSLNVAQAVTASPEGHCDESTTEAPVDDGDPTLKPLYMLKPGETSRLVGGVFCAIGGSVRVRRGDEQPPYSAGQVFEPYKPFCLDAVSGGWLLWQSLQADRVMLFEATSHVTEPEFHVPVTWSPAPDRPFVCLSPRLEVGCINVDSGAVRWLREVPPDFTYVPPPLVKGFAYVMRSVDIARYAKIRLARPDEIQAKSTVDIGEEPEGHPPVAEQTRPLVLTPGVQAKLSTRWCWLAPGKYRVERGPVTVGKQIALATVTSLCSYAAGYELEIPDDGARYVVASASWSDQGPAEISRVSAPVDESSEKSVEHPDRQTISDLCYQTIEPGRYGVTKAAVMLRYFHTEDRKAHGAPETYRPGQTIDVRKPVNPKHVVQVISPSTTLGVLERQKRAIELTMEWETLHPGVYELLADSGVAEIQLYTAAGFAASPVIQLSPDTTFTAYQMTTHHWKARRYSSADQPPQLYGLRAAPQAVLIESGSRILGRGVYEVLGTSSQPAVLISIRNGVHAERAWKFHDGDKFQVPGDLPTGLDVVATRLDGSKPFCQLVCLEDVTAERISVAPAAFTPLKPGRYQRTGEADVTIYLRNRKSNERYVEIQSTSSAVTCYDPPSEDQEWVATSDQEGAALVRLPYVISP